MQDTNGAVPHEAHAPSHHTPGPTHHSTDYTSNPIQTTKEGMQLLFRNAKGVLAGVITMQALLAIVGIITCIIALLAILVAVFAQVFNSSPVIERYVSDLLATVPPDYAAVIGSLSNSGGAAVVVAMIAGAITIFTLAYAQAAAYVLVGATVLEARTTRLGEVMGLAFKRTGALAVQWLLFVLAIVFAAILPAILFTGIDSMMIVIGTYYIALLVAILYFAARLSFAAQALVSLKMGPIQSIKHSWGLTKGKTWEILGAIGVVATVSALIDILFLFVHSALTSSPGTDLLVTLLEFVIVLMVGIAAIVALAQRFSQIRTAGAHGHKVNYGVNVGMFALAIILVMISGGIERALMPKTALDQYNIPTNTELNEGDYFDAESLQQEIDQFYQDSQNMYDSDLDAEYESANPEDGYRLN